jgi:hypothetical protein
MRMPIVLSCLCLFLSANAVVHAETLTFSTILSGSKEKVPNQLTGTGTAHVSLDTLTRTVTYRVEYTGLTGVPSIVHMHGLRPPSGGAPEVIIMRTDKLASPVVGSQVLTELQVEQLRHGDCYVNIHTKRFPDGEIRGWLTLDR